MDYYFLSIGAIFTSVIGAAYYLRIIKFIYFYDDVFMPYYISKSYEENSNNNDYIKISKKRCPDEKSTFKNIMALDGSRIRSEMLGQALKLVVEKLFGGTIVDPNYN